MDDIKWTLDFIPKKQSASRIGFLEALSVE